MVYKPRSVGMAALQAGFTIIAPSEAVPGITEFQKQLMAEAERGPTLWCCCKKNSVLSPSPCLPTASMGPEAGRQSPLSAFRMSASVCRNQFTPRTLASKKPGQCCPQ